MYFRARESQSVGFKSDFSSQVLSFMSFVKKKSSGWPEGSENSRHASGNSRVSSEPVNRYSGNSPRAALFESGNWAARTRRARASPPSSLTTSSNKGRLVTLQNELPDIASGGKTSSRQETSSRLLVSSNRRNTLETKTINITATTNHATHSAQPTSGAQKPLCCDKCDGRHLTDDCPHYKKQRDNHPDAQKGGRSIGGTSTLPGAFYYNARVVKQPGDGSCLFHSLSYGLRDGTSANTLRSEICTFLERNPDLEISETPLRDWVRWDSGVSVADYARRMARGAWGGGIEMATVSKLKRVNVHVYERCATGFKRISAFDHPDSPESRKTIRVLYCGGVHYDALVV